MKLDAKYVNRACAEAADECPQNRYDFAGGHREGMGDGSIVKVHKLHKKGLPAVLAYWADRETLGGDLLWEYGYWKCLPDDVQELFDEYEKVVSNAVVEAFGESQND